MLAVWWLPNCVHADHDGVSAVVLVPGIIMDADSDHGIIRAQQDYWSDVDNCFIKLGLPPLDLVSTDPDTISLSAPLSNQVAADCRVYAVIFSPGAARGSLESRAVELSTILSRVAARHQGPITLLAHSAGGLVARIVCQKALAGLKCPQTVKHLVTIGTPHQGSVYADNFGKLAGTRGESLRTDSPIIQTINELPLPNHMRFTSVVVGSFGFDGRTPGRGYKIAFDKSERLGLPLHLKRGGDGVVHNISQNLLFTPTGAQHFRTHQASMRILPFRYAIPQSGRGIVKQISSIETLHSAIFRIDDFCQAICKLAIERLDQHSMTELEARCLVQNHVEEQILQGLRGSISEVISIGVPKLLIDETEISYSADAVWKDWKRQSKRFTGSFPVERNPELRILVRQ